MIAEHIHWRVPEKEWKDFLSAVDRAQASLAESEFCRSWEMSRCVEEPDVWILRIDWISLDGHLKDFRQGPHYADYQRPLRRFEEYLVSDRHYKANLVHGRKE